MSIIFDEEKHVLFMLDNGFQTSRNNKFEIQLLANYYRMQGLDKLEIEEKIHSFCKKHITNYNRVKFYKMIDEKVKKSEKMKLKKSTPINITKKEMETILREDNIKCQKLMFVYLVLAKYYMSNNKTDKYYVGCKDTDIFNLCDMYTRKQDKIELMHYLTKKGYITPTLSMSSIINYVFEDSEVVLTFIPDTDMVYYFEQYLGDLFVNCLVCGKLTKKRSNRTLYCNQCAKDIKNGKIEKP